jgi:hypothetical protein
MTVVILAIVCSVECIVLACGAAGRLRKVDTRIDDRHPDA